MDTANVFLKDDFDNDINRDIWAFDNPPVLINDHSWKISEDFARTGNSSLQITCNPGDMAMPGNGGKPTERAEFIEKKIHWLKHDTNIWYAFSFLFPKDFVINDNRLVFAQWKQSRNNYSPFLSIRYISGNLNIKICDLDHQRKFLVKLTSENLWHDVLVNYQLNNNQTGNVTIWFDQKNVLDYEGKMGFPLITDDIYFKMGIYRDLLNIPQTIYLDRFRRGPTKKYCVD